MKVEKVVGNVLRYGVLVAGGVIALGLALSFLLPQNTYPPLAGLLEHLLRGEVLNDWPTVPCVTWECLGNPNQVITLGLMLLIGLPILRVALTLVLFIVERDFVYVMISAIVLVVLVTGIWMGKAI